MGIKYGRRHWCLDMKGAGSKEYKR